MFDVAEFLLFTVMSPLIKKYGFKEAEACVRKLNERKISRVKA